MTDKNRNSAEERIWTSKSGSEKIIVEEVRTDQPHNS
jgi:hypothetical protein